MYLILGLLGLFLLALPAQAQDALVVTTCGTLPQVYAVGSTRQPTVDVNGTLCTTVPAANPVTTFQVTASPYNAKCDGVTDDTTAIQTAINAWKVATVLGGTTILSGPGLSSRCKVTAPLNFTNTAANSNLGAIVRDLWIYGVFNYTGPVGTVAITNAGNYTTPGTYNNVPLTGGAGTGCTAASIVVAANVVQSVVLSAPGCGSAYVTGNTLSASTANLGGTGTGGLVLTVSTLSGGAIVDALGTLYVNYQNVYVEGDCTSIPNANFAFGRYSSAVASNNRFDNVRLLGCWQFAALYNQASENVEYDGLMVFTTRATGSWYGVVLDGTNHFNWSSTFQTVTNAIESLLGFSLNMFNNTRIYANTSTAATPLFITRASQFAFNSSYLAGTGTCGVILWANSNTRSSNLEFNMHVETTAMTNTFCLQGGDTAFKLINVTYNDSGSQVTGALFSPDTNIVSVTASGFNVIVSESMTGTVFGNPTIWTVQPDRIQVPGSGNFVAPLSMLTGGWICIGQAACTASGIPLVTVYGAGSTTHTLNPGTLNVRLIGCGPGGGGGSGAKQNTPLVASGGAGGSGGACFDRTFRVSDLTSPMQVQVGAGGAGGTQPGAGPVAGVAGLGGTLATCVSSTATCGGTRYVVGGFGGGGSGGQLAANSASGGGGCINMATVTGSGASTSNGADGAGSTPGAACTLGQIGIAGANGTTITSSNNYGTVGGVGGGGNGTTGAAAVGSSMMFGASGGGAGGGITAGAPGTPNNGGNGGFVTGIIQTATAGGTVGTPTGGTPTGVGVCYGLGGGGGGYGNATAGATSGTGGPGVRGGGGGGGGAVDTGGTAGLGGQGGDGFLCVMEML